MRVTSRAVFVAALAVTTQGLVGGSAQADLVGWWSFDEGIRDRSGHFQDAAYVGGDKVIYSGEVPAAVGGGESIDLQGDEVVVVAHAPALLFDQAFSVSYWVRGSAEGLGGKTMVKAAGAGETVWEVQDADGSGERSRMTTRPDGGSFTFGPEYDASDGGWHHVAYIVQIRSGFIEHDLWFDGGFVGMDGVRRPRRPSVAPGIWRSAVRRTRR